MPNFDERSLTQLETCHADLKDLLYAAIVFVDFLVIEGHRSTDRQKELYGLGRSQLDGIYKRSKHQETPSEAVDIMPLPRDLHGVNIWDDTLRWAHFIGTIKGMAISMGIDIRVGMDWNGDGSTKDHRLVDYPHIELA